MHNKHFHIKQQADRELRVKYTLSWDIYNPSKENDQSQITHNKKSTGFNSNGAVLHAECTV